MIRQMDSALAEAISHFLHANRASNLSTSFQLFDRAIRCIERSCYEQGMEFEQTIDTVEGVSEMAIDMLYLKMTRQG